MVFIPVVDTVMAEMRFTLYGQQIENTLYFKHTGSVGSAELDDIAAYVDDFATSKYMAMTCLAPQISYRETYVTLLTTETAPTAANADGAGTTGPGATAAMPGNVCIAVSFRTAERGRSARGRNYVSGLQASVISGNQLNSTGQAQIIGAYTQLISSPLPDWTWVVVSRYADGVARVAGVTLPVTSVTIVDANLDSQRRRLTGRGE